MGRRWTEKDVDDLRRMSQKLPAPLIAEIIDRTVGAVAFKAQQLKLSLPTRQGRPNLRENRARNSVR
jgi:hypothetical protein